MQLRRFLVCSGISSALASPRTTLTARLFSRASCPCRKKCCRRGFLIWASGPPQPQRQTGCANHSASIAALAPRLIQARRIASERGETARVAVSCGIILPLKTAEILAHKMAELAESKCGRDGVSIKAGWNWSGAEWFAAATSVAASDAILALRSA